jgi:hypothetical protein
MSPDPAALNLTASWAQRIGVPVSLAMTIVTGESEWNLYAEGDGGLAHGGLQVRTDVHGHNRDWWVGLAGLDRSFSLMAWRWRQAWDRLGRNVAHWHAEPVAFIREFWPAAQGARQSVVNARAEEVVRKGLAVYREWWRKQQGGGKEDSVIEQPTIQWVGAHPGNFSRSRGGISLEAVVWHVTEGGMPGPWFNDPRSRASTNYAVSKTGRIEQYVALADTPFAHGSVEVTYESARPLIRDNWGINPNTWAASIEFEGTPAEVHAGIVPAPAQQAAAARLTAWLFATELFDPAANARPLPNRDTILMHRDISPRTKSCPVWGEDVHARMIRLVQDRLSPPMPPKPEPAPVPPDPRDALLREAIDLLTLESREKQRQIAALTIQDQTIQALIEKARV